MGLKYHVVFIPKYRQRILYGKTRKKLGEIIRDLCRYQGLDLMEGHAIHDHIHLWLRIPLKYSVAHAIGYLKGKSAVRIHRAMGNKRVSGLHFWATGYCVSTVGLDEVIIKEYIRNQEKLETQQMTLYIN